MKNWKTTVFGILAFVAFALPPGILPPRVQDIVSGIAVAVGLGSAKDKDVTGAGSMARRVQE